MADAQVVLGDARPFPQPPAAEVRGSEAALARFPPAPVDSQDIQSVWVWMWEHSVQCKHVYVHVHTCILVVIVC